MFTRNKELFTEAGPVLTKSEKREAARLARRAAFEAQQTVTLTAKRQYRRYRKDAGDRFMAWPLWRKHYRAAIAEPVNVDPAYGSVSGLSGLTLP